MPAQHFLHGFASAPDRFRQCRAALKQPFSELCVVPRGDFFGRERAWATFVVAAVGGAVDARSERCAAVSVVLREAGTVLENQTRRRKVTGITSSVQRRQIE